MIGVVPTALASVVDAPEIEASSEMLVHIGNRARGDCGHRWYDGESDSLMFQTDSVGLRFILLATWAVRLLQVIAWD